MDTTEDRVADTMGCTEPVENARGEQGKSRKSKNAGGRKPTTREMIDSHKLSIAAATDHVAGTRQNIDQEGNPNPGTR